MATPLGKDATLNRNTGTFGSPTYNPIDNVQNLSVDATRGEANTSTRGSDVATIATTQKVLAISWDLVYVPSDADFTALETAFNSNVTIELFCCDGPTGTAGNKGWHGDWYMTKFSRKEDLDGVIMYECEAKPAKTANTMTWVTTA